MNKEILKKKNTYQLIKYLLQRQHEILQLPTYLKVAFHTPCLLTNFSVQIPPKMSFIIRQLKVQSDGIYSKVTK